MTDDLTVLACEAISVARDWQTLIASLIALCAAGWTIRTIRHQINEENRRHVEARRSKAWAARAKLPDALSRLCKFTEDCVAFLRIGADERAPEPPTEAMNIVKACVEYIDPQSAKKLFELVVHYQIHNSRLHAYQPNDGAAENVERLYDSVYLRYLVDRLFEFARDEVDVVPDEETNSADMISALRNAVGIEEYFGNQEEFAPVREIIERSFPEQ